MPDSAPPFEELGYFYDTIHGRFALEDLPAEFHDPLKVALSSKALIRLKGISQLGHTSVSFFSATHTRFSHAIGTMLVMDKLFRHLEAKKGLPQTLPEVISKHYQFDSWRMLHCHLLLVALYQDAGELPFQKVTSLYFRPALSLRRGRSHGWTGKQIFSLTALIKDMDEHPNAFSKYDRDFLTYLMTTRSADIGDSPLGTVLQLVDGFAIDADRLDYVYRDALATIGSLSSPSSVIDSIVKYEPQGVVVNDPRPVTDFLGTRMRLFTFVYNSADVRFRQALLKTVLDGYSDSAAATSAFKEQKLDPDLDYDDFLKLDDNTLLKKIADLDVGDVLDFRQKAKEVLLRAIPEYEYRILERRPTRLAAGDEADWPSDVFFDLVADHHQLYRPRSVFVSQHLTREIDVAVPLEKAAGALSQLFFVGNSPMLVPGGFYLFLPRGWESKGRDYRGLKDAISSGAVFERIRWEDVRRIRSGLPADTRTRDDFLPPVISISYCHNDLPTVAAIVRELYNRRRRYLLFWDHDEIQGTGTPVADNSRLLVNTAGVILAVCSIDYLRKYFDNSYVSIEIRAMHDHAKTTPVIPLGVDSRDELDRVEKWFWHYMNEDWHNQAMCLSNPAPLKDASMDVIQQTVSDVLATIERLKAQV